MSKVSKGLKTNTLFFKQLENTRKLNNGLFGYRFLLRKEIVDFTSTISNQFLTADVTSTKSNLILLWQH